MSRTTGAAGWVPVCALEAIQAGRGVCALVEGRAVAVFRVHDEVCAVDDVDPASGVPVLSRGLVGATEVDGRQVLYVASPLRKQRFDLRSGRCLDHDHLAVGVHPVTVRDGTVLVGTVPAGAAV